MSDLRQPQIGFGAQTNRTTIGEPPRARPEKQGRFAKNIGFLFPLVASKSLPYDLHKKVKKNLILSSNAVASVTL